MGKETRSKDTSLTHDLLWAWKRLVLIREFELLLARMGNDGRLQTPIHLAVGQEAMAVAVEMHKEAGDMAFGTHRSHAHYLAFGGSVRDLLAEILGRRTGCSGGRGGSMHLTAPLQGFAGSMPIVASTIPIAVGAALSLKVKKTDNISVAFFGDGATEEGVFHESLNLASIYSLPTLFVCENNYLSSHLHIDYRQKDRNLTRFSLAHHIRSIRLTEYSFEELFNSVGTLINYVRKEKRPGFIEIETYRWLGHVGGEVDLDIGKGRRSDLNSWKERDVLAHLGASLSIQKIFPREKQEEHVEETRQSLQKVFWEVESDPEPTGYFTYEIES